NVRLSPAEVATVLAHCEPRVVVASHELDNLLADDDSDLQVPRNEDDLAEILYTSGTTSTPKGVAIRHSNSALFLRNNPDWTGRAWLHASPMFTFAGLTFVYTPMRMGLRTLYLPRFTVADWLRLLADEAPTNCFLVPSMVELLVADPASSTADWSSVEMISVGSAPIAPTTLARLQDLVPDAQVTNAYSMTEAGTAYFFMAKGQQREHPGSVGRVIPPAEVRIVDDDGAELSAGEIGNVEVKPAGRMREYYRAPEATREVFHPDGWLRTGDLGWLDAAGYLSISGRAKDVIIRGGLNIHAADVEAVLYEHSAVREAAVVGAPHPVLGEEVVAFVVLRAGATASADELIAHCAGRLANYAVPRRVHRVDDLPRNATGKVMKRDLVEPDFVP
ncbi:MAG TPA: fatty acid--CoA ligase family protein, partial [Mycobacteriales bacterium]|nr:fatty acid--CoA ligase family protein [Mycobacteriales bacterium]